MICCLGVIAAGSGLGVGSETSSSPDSFSSSPSDSSVSPVSTAIVKDGLPEAVLGVVVGFDCYKLKPFLAISSCELIGAVLSLDVLPAFFSIVASSFSFVYFGD